MTDFLFYSRNRLIQAGDTVYRYDTENQRIGVNQIQFVVNSQPALSQVLIKASVGCVPRTISCHYCRLGTKMLQGN